MHRACSRDSCYVWYTRFSYVVPVVLYKESKNENKNRNNEKQKYAFFSCPKDNSKPKIRFLDQKIPFIDTHRHTHRQTYRVTTEGTLFLLIYHKGSAQYMTGHQIKTYRSLMKNYASLCSVHKIELGNGMKKKKKTYTYRQT